MWSPRSCSMWCLNCRPWAGRTHQNHIVYADKSTDVYSIWIHDTCYMSTYTIVHCTLMYIVHTEIARCWMVNCWIHWLSSSVCVPFYTPIVEFPQFPLLFRSCKIRNETLPQKARAWGISAHHHHHYYDHQGRRKRSESCPQCLVLWNDPRCSRSRCLLHHLFRVSGPIRLSDRHPSSPSLCATAGPPILGYKVQNVRW